MTRLSTQTQTVLNKAGYTSMEEVICLSDAELMAIPKIGPKRLEEIRAIHIDSTVNAENIRASIVMNKFSMGDIENLRVRAEQDTTLNQQWSVLFEMVNKFITSPAFDKDINGFLSDLPEMEMHNAIATLSYRLNSRGTDGMNQHYREQAKLSVAAMVLIEYHKLTQGRIDSTYIRGTNAVNFGKEILYIGNENITLAKKNSLAGITYTPAKPQTKVKGKAGLKSVKLTSRAKNTLKNGNRMEHTICDDINTARLYRYLLNSNEYISTKDGKFLAGRTVGSIERKELIKERLLMLRTRYRSDISNYKMIVSTQKEFNNPMYLEIKYEYRGRVNYVNNNLLLGPQTKIGKKMWKSYNPRILNKIDYKYIAFIIVSSISRIDLDSAIETFEKDITGNIEKYLDKANGDYMNEVYAKRVVNAYFDYKDGKENSTYLFTDYTNSGGIRFAVGLTREPKAMAVCNVLSVKTVSDVHGLLRTAANKIVSIPGSEASRDDIKSALSQSITAGVAPESGIKKFNDFFLDEHNIKVNLTKEQYTKTIEDVYGKTGSLFHEFNKEMNSFYDNDHSELDIDTRDGFPARSIAYLKGHESKIYYVSTNESRSFNKLTNSNNLKSMSLTRDMPILYILKDGKYVAASSATKKFINGKEVVVYSKAKDKGGSANTTHADDSVPVRAKIDFLASVGGSGIFIHDNDATCGMLQEGLLNIGKADLIDAYDKQPFLMALRSASKDSPRVINESKYVIGTHKSFKPGNNFMQP